MKPLKPASATAWRLRDKLQALADYGFNGEKSVAQAKLDALIAKYDWTRDPRKIVQKDVFGGKFVPASYASHVLAFSGNDYDIAGAVKWGIESRTGIRCVWRGTGELWAQADPSSVKRLTDAAKTVSEAFRALWHQFSRASGVEPQDRSIFVAGLADGMLGEKRSGKPLPCLPRPQRKSAAPGISVHPYEIAVKLGESVRFSVPLEEITNQLAEAIAPAQIEGTK